MTHRESAASVALAWASFDRLTPDGGNEALDRLLAEEVPVAVEFNGIGYAVLMATPSDIAIWFWASPSPSG